MTTFKEFLIESEEKKDTNEILKKIPKSHADLVKGFKFIWQAGNTLKGDNDHTGIIDPKKKTITLSGGWRYPRSFTFLHELAHQVYAYLNHDLKAKWAKLLKQTIDEQKEKLKQANRSIDALNQNEEEIFCMAYASTYTNHAPIIFHNKEWEKFIKTI